MLLALELPIERQRRVVAAATLSGHTSLRQPWRLRVADIHLDTALALTSGPLEARRGRRTRSWRNRRRTLARRFSPEISTRGLETAGGIATRGVRFPACRPQTAGDMVRTNGAASNAGSIFAAGPAFDRRAKLPSQFRSDPTLLASSAVRTASEGLRAEGAEPWERRVAQQREYARGSTRAPFARTAQCRCGPVTRPVAPNVPPVDGRDPSPSHHVERRQVRQHRTDRDRDR
jgi:hypothetical protein